MLAIWNLGAGMGLSLQKPPIVKAIHDQVRVVKSFQVWAIVARTNRVAKIPPAALEGM